MISAYALVYAATPNELAWHLQSSMDRLILHLIPPAIFAVSLLLRPTAESNWRLVPTSLVVIVCAWGAIENVRALPNFHVPNRWREYQQQLVDTQAHGFAEHLPEGCRLGFANAGETRIASSSLYQAVRFFLAPRVVQADLDADWIIAFHPRKDAADAFAVEHRLELVNDPGTNLRLYRRTKK